MVDIDIEAQTEQARQQIRQQLTDTAERRRKAMEEQKASQAEHRAAISLARRTGLLPTSEIAKLADVTRQYVQQVPTDLTT